MYINEMELRARYEMKKEEVRLAMLASRFKNNFKKSNVVQKPNCCEIKIQEVCCQN
jgi:hypothetical protein